MLTPAELTLIADEIQRLPLPARVDRIHEPRADRIVIRLESGGAAADLLITTARPFPRAHFVTGRAPNPRTPPPFCEDLRRILMPGALVRATTPPHDATLALEFEVRIDDGPRVRRTLVAELFGAHPNILVIDDRDRILAVLRPRDSEVRRLMPGATYERRSPPKRSVAEPAAFSSLGAREPGESASRFLERTIGPREEESFAATAREALLAEVGDLHKKLARRLENIGADQRSTEAVPRLRAEGELLKAHLGLLKRGLKQVTVPAWEDGREKPVVIALDPKRTPHQEVTFRFDEARRLERLVEAAAERRREVEERLAALDAVAAAARAARTEDEVAAVRETARLPARPVQTAGRTAARVEPRKPYRSFTSKDGIEILVGRTASDNDELTFHVANGNDFWFHVRDYPGSHVVIRARDELPEQTLLDAATLAVHFSRGAKGGRRDVSWTRRKYVSKARGAPAGQVMLSSHKTIHMRPDPARLERLLRGAPGAG